MVCFRIKQYFLACAIEVHAHFCCFWLHPILYYKKAGTRVFEIQNVWTICKSFLNKYMCIFTQLILYIHFNQECFCWGGKGRIKSLSLQFPHKKKEYPKQQTLADGYSGLHEWPCHCAGYLGKFISNSLSPGRDQQGIMTAIKQGVKDLLKSCINQHGRVTLELLTWSATPGSFKFPLGSWDENLITWELISALLGHEQNPYVFIKHLFLSRPVFTLN